MWALMKMPPEMMANTSSMRRLPMMANSTVARPESLRSRGECFMRTKRRLRGRAGTLPRCNVGSADRVDQVADLGGDGRAEQRKRGAGAQDDDRRGDGVLHRGQTGIVGVGLDGRG